MAVKKSSVTKGTAKKNVKKIVNKTTKNDSKKVVTNKKTTKASTIKTNVAKTSAAKTNAAKTSAAKTNAAKTNAIEKTTKSIQKKDKVNLVKPVTSVPVVEEKMSIKQKSNLPIKNIIFAIVVIAVFVMAICFALFFNESGKSNVSQVGSANELSENLKNTQMKEPVEASDIKYSIEDNDIARMEYKKVVSDGKVMNFVMKSSSATEEDITGLHNSWGTKIIMEVICSDGSDIEVESYVATDDSNVMKSTWYDNDLYYSMTTDNLVTREDFLQEVNKVIIDNHIEFN